MRKKQDGEADDGNEKRCRCLVCCSVAIQKQKKVANSLIVWAEEWTGVHERVQKSRSLLAAWKIN